MLYVGFIMASITELHRLWVGVIWCKTKVRGAKVVTDGVVEDSYKLYRRLGLLMERSISHDPYKLYGLLLAKNLIEKSYQITPVRFLN